MRTLLSTIALSLVALSPAVADDANRTEPPLKIDFDELKGKMAHRDGIWLVEVHFEIEVEDARDPIALDLRLAFTENDRVLTESTGEPFEVYVTLDSPTELDDDEAVYEGAVFVEIPRRSFVDPDELRLHGDVFLPGADRPIATEDESVKYRKPRRRPWLHLGVGIGPVGVGVGL